MTSGCSNGYVQYNPNTKTLTLCNITIKRTGSGNYAVHNRKCDDLTIEFIGNCYLYPDNAPAMKIQRNTTINISGTSTRVTVKGNSSNNKPAVEIDDGRSLTIKGTRGNDWTNQNFLGFYGGNGTTPAIKGGSSITFKGDCWVYISNTYRWGGYCLYQQTLNFNLGCDVELYDGYTLGDYGVVNGCTINVNYVSSSGVKIITPLISPYTGYHSNGAFYVNSGEKAHRVRITNHYVALLNSDYFPDLEFQRAIYWWNESAVLDNDPFEKGYIMDLEMPYVKNLDVSNKQISKLNGIEYFTYLEKLNCSKNNISGTLSLSKLTKLKELNCSENSLGWLTISSSAPLTALDCSNNKILSLDVSSLSNLTELQCSSNKLSSLNVTNKTKLTSIDAAYNELTSINVQGCNALRDISCFWNKINASGANTLINSLCTIPSGSLGNLLYIDVQSNSIENNVSLTEAQVKAARNKRWMPKKWTGSAWVDISATSAGDVNGDGEVTAADITALYDFLLNNDSSHLVNGDQNGDGNITSADITAVYDVLLGNN